MFGCAVEKTKQRKGDRFSFPDKLVESEVAYTVSISCYYQALTTRRPSVHQKAYDALFVVYSRGNVTAAAAVKVLLLCSHFVSNL